MLGIEVESKVTLNWAAIKVREHDQELMTKAMGLFILSSVYGSRKLDYFELG